jgi:hypothetical protein
MKVVASAVASLFAIGVLGLGAVAPISGDFGDHSYDELVSEVLARPSIGLLPGARRDVETGLMDARILRLLLILAERHELSAVGPLVSGHSYYVKGTNRPSNHAFGRAVDILELNGAPVNVRNLGALDAARQVVSLDSPLRPDEVGAPWPLYFPGVSTFVKDHDDHLHFGHHGAGRGEP